MIHTPYPVRIMRLCGIQLLIVAGMIPLCAESSTTADIVITLTLRDPTPTPTQPPAITPTPDIAPPAAPVLSTITHDMFSHVTEICGAAEANAMVRVYDGGTVLGSTTANGSGEWCYAPAPPLAAGPHSISAVAVDGSDNQSPRSSRCSTDTEVSVNAFMDTTAHSGSASLLLERVGAYDFKIAVNGGAPVTVRAWMRRNEAYTGTAPAATLTGLGIDGSGSATASMTAGADTWEQLTLTGTPNADGMLTLTVETSSAAEGAKAWVDDITVSQ